LHQEAGNLFLILFLALILSSKLWNSYGTVRNRTENQLLVQKKQ